MRVLAGCQIYIYAGSFLLGAVIVQQVSQLPSPGYLLLVLPIIALSIRIPWLRPIVFFALGSSWALIKADILLNQNLPRALERKEVRLDGVVTSLVQRDERYLKFTVDVESLRFMDRTYPAPGNVSLRWYYTDRNVSVGDGWRFTARLKRPHGFQNPGGFDYEKWLFRRGIRATGYIVGGERVPALDAGNWWRSWRQAVQLHLAGSGLTNHGLLAALAVGARDDVNPEQWEVLQRTGTVHLLAISGLHIGLVSGFCFVLGLVLARLLGPGLLWWPAAKVGAVTAVIGAATYALLAGFTVPTQRATIMVVVFMSALLFDRAINLPRNLAVALLAVLMFDPLSVLDTGFWLSFGALASIVLALRVTARFRSRLVRLLLVQISLTLLLAPLVLLFFGRVSVSAPLANLIAIPVVAFAVVPLVLCGSAALALGWEEAADTLYELGDTALGLLWHVLTVLAEPGWAVWVHSPGLVAALLALAGIAWQFCTQRWYFRLAGFLLILPLTWDAMWREAPDMEDGEFQATVLDVGQGLSVAVRTRRHLLLYDTGARFSRKFDAGSAVVVPWLRHQRLPRIDTLVVSHGDNDHIGGLRAVLRHVDTGRRLTSIPDRVPGGEACIAGQEWIWDGVHFLMLSPLIKNPPEHNNASCVIKVTGRYGTFLLTGDIEREVEQALLDLYGEDLRSDVLLVPHQGSKTSSTPAFIDTVAPSIGVLASGYLNHYGHPAETVVRRYRERAIPLFNTAEDGAVTVEVNRSGINVDRYRESNKRYWFSGPHPGPLPEGPSP